MIDINNAVKVPAIAWQRSQRAKRCRSTAPPDHSTVSRTRRRVDVETHLAVFTWVLQRLADADLVGGKTVGIDATTLEANAALRSIVRRDTGAGCETFLRQLAVASGIATPTRAELARLDRKRPKKGSNDDWTHPKDPDAKITKMKDGRTRLAHKTEHAVDLRGEANGSAAPWRGCPLGLVHLNLREFCFCRKLEEARVGEVGHFRKHQQIVAPEALRALPLIAVFVEAGKGDIVPRLFVGSIAPNRSLDATDPDFINGFLVSHNVFPPKELRVCERFSLTREWRKTPKP